MANRTLIIVIFSLFISFVPVDNSYAEVCFPDDEAIHIENMYYDLDQCKESLPKYEIAKEELKSTKDQLKVCEDRGFFTNIGWMGGILLTALAIAL